MRINKSRSYVGILLGGHPASLDKIMEIVADPKQHLKFVYGFGVFVIFFHSKKGFKEIKKIFQTNWATREIDMFFIIRNNQKSKIIGIRNDLKEKLDATVIKENLMMGDLRVLREVLYFLGIQHNMMQNAAHHNMEQFNGTEKTDHDVLKELLEKMKREGYSALTPAEMEFLEEYKEKYNDNQTDVD